MATCITDIERVYAHLTFRYDDWLCVLDALESDATETQREAAQDSIQRRAPRGWIAAVEARDDAR